MAHPEISIIMPAFNVAPFLGASVESVRNQRGVDWELLIIDDGSTDATRDIARAYAAADRRIRALDNRRGKGAGGCRNTGLRAAGGGLIYFLDGDDFLLPGALRALSDCLADSGGPVVRGLGAKFCMQRWLPYTHKPEGEKGSVRVYSTEFPPGGFWLHLYRADFLAGHGIDFPEDMPIGQDSVFLCRVYSLLERLPVLQRPVHLYRINHKRNAISGSKAVTFALLAARVRAIFEERGRGAWVVPYLENRFFTEWLRRLHTAMSAGPEQTDRFMRHCRDALTGLEDAVRPVLRAQLGDLADPFGEACAAGDAQAMLEILKRSGRIRPELPYMGIDRRITGASWRVYRLLRRTASLILLPEAAKTLAFLARYRCRAAAFARRSGRK